jgi:exonuclease VII small subunit
MSDNVLQAKLALSDRNRQLASTCAEKLTQARFQVIKITLTRTVLKSSALLPAAQNIP